MYTIKEMVLILIMAAIALTGSMMWVNKKQEEINNGNAALRAAHEEFCSNIRTRAEREVRGCEPD